MKKLFLVFVLVLFTAQFSLAQWEDDVRLTNDANSSITNYNMRRSIAAINDFVHVVWKDNRDGNWEVYYKRSTDGGINWSPDTRFTIMAETSSGSSIAVSGTNVHVVWNDNRNGNLETYYRRSIDGGTSWEADVRLTEDPTLSYASVIALSGSYVHVAWIDCPSGGERKIHYKHSTDEGISWEEDMQLTNENEYSLNPSIATSGTNVHVVWNGSRNGNEGIIYKRSMDGGISWEPDIQLTDDTFESQLPSIAVSGSTVHVAWIDNRDTDWGYEIYYKHSLDGGVSWSEDIQLTNDGYSTSMCPNLTVSGPVVHMVWEDDREGNYNIYYKRSEDGGENWEADTLISGNGGMSSQHACVAVSSSVLHTVWYDDRDGNNEIYYKRNPTGGISVGIENELPRNSSQVVSLYPNPASTILNINFSSPTVETITLRFMDMSGKTFRTYNFKAAEGMNQYTINLDDFRNGVYLIGLTDGTNRIFQKVIIKK